MGLNVGATDKFEKIYKAKFASMAANYGLRVDYEMDRAAIDLGLHLTEPKGAGETVTDTRVWFQFKGKMQASLSREQFESAEHVALSLEMAHLRQWYRSPEPVYLTVYIESVDTFLAVDVK